MAIIKDIILPNGVITTYHRIALVTIDSNSKCTILINSYLSKDGRQIEKDYSNGVYNDLELGAMVFPYVNSEYISLDYDPDMTLEKAYKTIKQRSEFVGSEDDFDEWNGDGIKYNKGDYISYNGKIYKVLQKHTSQPDWTPVNAVSLFMERPDPRIDYSEFIKPTGAHDAYNQGDKITFNGNKYESLINNNAWSPEEYPQGWKKIDDESIGESGEEKYPEFVQPSGSHNAYSKGDRIIYNGDAYESLLDGNTWSPDAYPAGWKKL